MLLRLLQQHRTPADRADGRRHHQDRRSVRQGRIAGKLLSEADIAANIAGIQQIFARFLSFGSGPTDAVMVNNADWLDGLHYIPFLRDYRPPLLRQPHAHASTA